MEGLTAEKISKEVNKSFDRITSSEDKTNKMLRSLKPGESISVKDIKRTYGKNWMKSLKCIPISTDVNKRDKKKAKATRKARKLNRKK